MAISLREVVQDARSDDTAAQVTTGAGTLATDLLVAVGWSSFYTLGTFGPPSGGGWTQIVTADRGTDDTKLRAWWRVADGGAQAVSLAPIIDEDVGLVVLVLAGADTATPVDDAAGATSDGGGGTPSLHVAPSVSPASADAYLACAAGTAVFTGGVTYASPGGMTEQADFAVPSNAISCTAATEQLAASGPTGTRTFEYAGTADPGLAISVAIRTASTGVTGTLAVAEEPDTLASAGTATPPSFTGTLAATEQADTLAAAGTHTPPPITGTLAVTEEDDVLAAHETAPSAIGTATLVPPALPRSTMVQPLRPSVTVVPPRAPTSGGVA